VADARVQRPRLHHLYPDAAGSLREATFQPAEFPEIKATPEISAAGTRFSQATGGRTGAPFPGRASAGQPPDRAGDQSLPLATPQTR
jgi:hypothetical protein